jgi:hypothetical protein
MCGKFTALASWSEVVAFSQPLTESGGGEGPSGDDGSALRVPGSLTEAEAAIAQELEARGVRTPAGRDRWDAKQVSRLLAE